MERTSRVNIAGDQHAHLAEEFAVRIAVEPAKKTGSARGGGAAVHSVDCELSGPLTSSVLVAYSDSDPPLRK